MFARQPLFLKCGRLFAGFAQLGGQYGGNNRRVAITRHWQDNSKFGGSCGGMQAEWLEERLYS